MNELKTLRKSEGFASRWSRRKHAVDSGEKPDLIEDEEKKAEKIALEQERIAEEEKVEKLAALNALTDDDMPDVDSLHEGSDYSQFMSTSVSEGLRKIALRKLFQGEHYNVRDGLDEYDGDYTYFEKLDPGTITADMKHLLEVEAENLKRMQEDMPGQDEAQDQGAESCESTDLVSAEDELEAVPEISNQEEGVLEEDEVPKSIEENNLITSDSES